MGCNILIYQINNKITSEFDYAETEELANAKLIENRDALVAREMFRFSVAKVTVEGFNTTWDNADLENDSEDGQYQVFNQNTGQHEQYSLLSEAKNRQQELINLFVAGNGLDAWRILNAPPEPTNTVDITTTMQIF